MTVTIEIHGTGTHNRGAELMSLAIADHFLNRFPECRIVVPDEFGSMRAIYAHGFHMSSHFSNHFVNRIWWTFAPPNLRRRIGLISPSEISIVLDASGFNFSDSWGPEGAKRLIKKMNSRSRRRQPLVFLPQAFGPFQSPIMINLMRKLIRRSTLICARDRESLKHLQAIDPSANLHLFPDFTFSLAPKAADVKLPTSPFVAIVPNARMLDKGSSAEHYLNFLKGLPKLLSLAGMTPLLVLHDEYEDAVVCDQIAFELRGIQRVSHKDPRVLKWVLGRASFVIGSRYHALVSALSQGIPCIGAGWSHKYAELFRDFNCEDTLLHDLSDQDRLCSLVGELSSPTTRKKRSISIAQHAAGMRDRSDTLWHLVDSIIDSKFY